MIETDDARNDRLRSEFEAKPNAAELTREFNLRHGEKTINPTDLKITAGSSNFQRQTDSADDPPVPDSELTPELRAIKEKYESRAASQAGATEGFQTQWQKQLAAIQPDGTERRDAGCVDPETQQRELEQAEAGMRDRWAQDYNQKHAELASGAQYVAQKYPDIFNDVAFSSLGNDPVVIDAIHESARG